MTKIVLALFISVFSLPALGQTAAITDFCKTGATQAMTSGLPSTNNLQGIIPSCLVTVYGTGTTNLATIYANAGSGTLGNPFRATQTGQWTFWASTAGCYDIVMSGGYAPNEFKTPVTLTGVCTGGGGGGGGSTFQPPNFAIQFCIPGSPCTPGGSAATVTALGAIVIPSTTNFKYDLGSPTAFFAGSIAAMEANCNAFPCSPYIDPQYIGTDGYGNPTSLTSILDRRNGQNITFTYNWLGSLVNFSSQQGSSNANQTNCIQDNLPGLTIPVGVNLSNCSLIYTRSTYPGWANGSNNHEYSITALSVEHKSNSAGIIAGIAVVNTKTGVGDLNAVDGYTNYTSGFTEASAQGVEPIVFGATEIQGMYTGTITNAVVNSSRQTVLTLSGASLAGSLGVGRPAIDTANVISGTITSVNRSTGIAVAAISGFTPAVSAACVQTTAPVNTPSQPINQNSLQTFSVTVGSGIITVGQKLGIAGNGAVGGANIEFSQVESLVSYAGGIQTFTARVTYEYATGTTVCAGGLQGFLESTVDTSSGFRYLYYVIGATDSTHILVTTQFGSNGLSSLVRTGPINIYHGGTLVDARNSTNNNVVDGGQITITNSSATWTVGDGVENSDLVSGFVCLLCGSVQNNNPYAPVTAFGISMRRPGYGQSLLLSAGNSYSPSLLTAYGGMYVSAPLVTAEGPAPPATGMVIPVPVGGSNLQAAALEVLPMATVSATATTCALSGNIVTLTFPPTVPAVAGGANPVTFSGFTACSFLNGQTAYTGSATSTTLVIPFGHSGTIAPTADPGTVAIGPLLPNQSYFIWHDDGLNKYIAFNPVSGALNFNVASANFNSTVVSGVANPVVGTDACNLQTCSGSGIVSGQANGVIPLATGTSTIGAQSHLDDGVTTAGTITSSEPIAVAASTLPSQIAFTYDSHALTPGSGTTAVYGVDSSGNSSLSEAGGSAARICTATNGVCTGGSTAFSSITSGTNTSAAMVVGTGASIARSGSGTIDASTLLGNTWAIPANIGTTTPGIGVFTDLVATSARAGLVGTIASASTIAPTTLIVRVTGTTTIETITPSSNCTSSGVDCELILLNADALLGTSGNISTAVSNGGSVYLIYDQSTSLWTPPVSSSSGTVTSVTVTGANGIGVSGCAITTSGTCALSLGAITPTSTNGVGAATMAFNDATSSIQTQLNGKAAVGVANTTVAVSSATQGANSCSSATTVTMTGLTTSMVSLLGYSANPAALTGWGSTGGMVFQAWPSATNTLSWAVCNQTSSPITYSAITFNVGAR